MRVLLLILLAFSLSACHKSPGPQDQSDLDRHRAQWQALGLKNYRYNFSRSCFCLPDYRREVIIRVENDQITSVVHADDGTQPESPELLGYRTMDGLFDLIQETIDDEKQTLSVTYKRGLGYPRYIAIDLEQQVIDGGMASRVNHVQINNTLHTSAVVTGNIPLSTANFKVSAAKLVEKENVPHLELSIDTDSSCGGSYFNVYASEALAKSLPPQTTVSLQRLPENDDQCDNPVSYQVSASLEELVEKFGANKSVILVLQDIKLELIF